MRRAMMTNRPFGGGVFIVGDPAISRGNTISLSNTLWMNLDNPAPRGGTITSYSLYASAAGAIRVLTGTWDGTTLTVSAVGPSLTLTVGLNTFSDSLSIPSGGFIGWWIATGSGTAISRDASGGSNRYFGTTSAPTAGATFTGGTANTSLVSLQGTGS